MTSSNAAELNETSVDQLLSVPNAAQNQRLLVIPGGTGTAVSYTLVYDVYVPSATAGSWVPFFQGDAGNGNDADLFGRIEGDSFGIGIGGNYQGEAALDAWNRIAFTVETGETEVTIKKYINGELIGSQSSGSLDRYAIDKAAGFLIFSDEDGETSPIHLSNFAYAETVLTDAQIAALGTANGEGIVSAADAAFTAANGSEFRFNDGTLEATFGAATLTPAGTEVVVETAADAGVPEVPLADQLLSIPAGAPDQTIKLTPGGTGTATEFTIAFDIYVSSEGNNGWIPFFQSDAANGSDSDLFGKVSGDSYGIGIGGNYQGEAKLDTWNRIAFTVEQKDGEVQINKYINGDLVGTQTSTSLDRYTIDKAAGFLIFTDEDGETSPVHVSNIAYVEVALNDTQMKAIGGPSADGIVPAILEPDFLAANGTEFRFTDGTLDATLGTGTLVPENTELTVESPLEAGVPAVSAPPVDGGEGEPIQLRSIADMMLTPDADTVVIDLGAHFTAEGLTFTLTNSDGEAVGARLIDGNKLEIDAKALGRSDVHIEAVDAAGQVYTDDFRVRVAGPNAYTIAVLPDTQDYVFPGTGQQTFNGMTQWLADNAEMLNLRFVTSVGDVTSGNTASEWAIAKEAFEKLNGVVPYAMLPGNHDQGGGASNYTSLQSQYFDVDYMQEHSTLGGVYDQEAGETKNAWYTFEGADGTKWINLSLEFGARDDVLRWAGEVLDAHSDYRAIVTTHHYTNMGTRADNYSGPLFGEGTGKDYGVGNSAENANDGEDMWQDLIYSHTNVSFVFSGHVFGDGAETIVSYNEAGQPVYQMFVNYQNGVSLEATGNGDATEGGNGGNGAIRLITIDPDNGKVYTETYLSAKDEYLTGSRGDEEPSRDGMGGDGSSGPTEVTQPVGFGTEALPDGDSGVINAPKFDPANGIKVTPGFEPSSGSTYANYTLVYDVKLPTTIGLTSIFQSDLNNITDGDLWLNNAGDHALIGTNGQDEGVVPLGEYIRLVITLERVGEGGSTYTMNKYVNGELQGTQTVGSAFNISEKGFLIFADDSGETTDFSMSSFAFVEKTLSAEEVAELGGPTASGPFTELLSDANMVQFDFTNGNLQANLGNGSMSQVIGDGSGTQLTGELREHEEEIDADLGTPVAQFRAEAGDGQTVAAGEDGTATVSLDAKGSVDKLGQIAGYEWLNADGEVVATTAQAELALGAGVHQLTLRATATDGTVSTDTVRVTVTDGDTLLSENFNDGNADGWTAPGARWQVAGSVQSRDTVVEGIAAPEGMLRAYDGASGIMAWAGAGSAAWNGYTVSATLTAEDQLGLGVVAYYTDAQNYYLLSFDIAENAHKLIRVQGGVQTVLASEAATTPFDRAFAVEFAVADGKLYASVDGEALFGGPVTDESPLSGGTVGVWSEGQRQVFFDDILVQKGTLIADAGKAIRVIDTDGDGKVDIDLSALSSNGLTGETTVGWSEDGEALANGAEGTVSLGTGEHLIRLDLANAGGTSSDTMKVEIVAADKVLVNEDFSDGLAQGFRFVDEGELGNAASWAVVDGVLQQTSDRYSRQLGGTGDTAPSSQWSLNWSPLGDGIYALRKGTYAVYEGEGASEWEDYSVETTFTSTSGGGVGLLLHYQDAENYYKFELDNQTGLPQLFSLKDGIEQTLWQGPTRYDTAGTNTLRADIVDGKLQVWLNGTALFTKPIEIHDTEKGTFGLYNWHAGSGVTYDNVTVVSLEADEPENTAPVAADDEGFTARAGQVLTLAAALLLANDTDANADALHILSVADAVGGTVSLDADGNVVFTPAAGFEGTASFSYTVTDGKGGTSTASVELDVVSGTQGTPGNDRLAGGQDDDVLSGGGGNDKLFGYYGDDQLSGGEGNDLLKGGDGDDQLDGGNGDDELDGGAGDDVVVGGNGDDTLLGQTGDDLLQGGAGNDHLNGGAGDDVVEGGNGNDYLLGGYGNDHLIGGNGNDKLSGGGDDDLLEGGNGDDQLAGGADDDVLLGGNGNDRFWGGGGDDYIDGGLGNDRLRGGEGDDVLKGGLGDDTFVFTENAGSDVIIDFTTGDVIEFSALDFATFDEVLAAMIDTAEGVVIQLDDSGNNTVLVEDMTKNRFGADDFQFS
ncbi:cadherin-like domain-containing protein [Ancylobacter sonchi]|uniref:cadherin-like domain-containing protein n=1 Tax=Ancylobacter sonchi TaxID=1937790 RepID=UPI001BD2C998|nr:cadherin-like domain-containing protein [Ancylobacter sonchi]MBS7534114.1 cadherin-like domain-containing protein [Ancylobacter sonchi]